MRLINKKFADGLAFTVLTKIFYRSLLELLVLRKNYLELWILSTALVSILKCLKLSSFFSFKILSDITAIDQLEKEYRFRLDYNLLGNSKRLMVTTFIKELEFCNSVTRVFSSANWLEREVWDLYGVYFLNHGDLRRILTDYGFRGYPFRKDFPLTGYIELRFDDSRGDVVYEPVELMQELRFFNFATGWEVD